MKTEYKLILTFVCVLNCFLTIEAFTSREVKCLVCKATVDELEKAIAKVDPKKKIEVGGFRIDSTGDSVSQTVQLKYSEVYLTELMESICDKLDDYAKAVYKSNGKFTVLKMMTEHGMHPDMSLVDFVQDGDLNKSLKHYCLEFLDDHEESALKLFMDENSTDITTKLCTTTAKYCPKDDADEDYIDDDEDESNRDEL